MKHANREAWLSAAIELLRPTFNAAGHPFPPTVHISIGFPSERGLSTKNRVVGQCWNNVSKDGFPHIFLNPVVTDGVQALAVLTHELLHASGIHGHKKDFATAMHKVGMTGKPTHTEAGDELKQRLNTLIETALGPYPHPSFDVAAMEKERKKQTTRLLKAECAKGDESEGKVYSVRITKVHLDKFGPPICPECLTRMKVDGWEPDTEEDDE